MTYIHKWGLFLLAVTVFCLSGCKYTFELNDKDMKSMLAVRTYMCADSLSTIYIHKTVPLTQIDKADTTLVSPRYTLTCNGKKVEARDSMIGEGGMAIIAEGFKMGDEISLTFETGDMETAFANTTIPEAFPQHSMELTTKGSTATRTLIISYKDNPETEDWYGVSVRWSGLVHKQYSNDYTNTYYENSGKTYPPQGYSDINLQPEAYSPLVVSFKDEYLYFWKDTDEADDTYELLFNYNQRYDYENNEVENRRIQCSLFKLSPQMYRHLYAEYDRQNNPLIDLGFASPTFTYSNIHNGLGYFCGYSETLSAWIEDNID